MTDEHQVRPAIWSRPGKDHSEDGIAGTYHVAADGRPIAQLHGVWPDRASSFFDDDQPEIIHGDAFGKAVTVVSPIRGNSSYGFGRLQNTTLHGQYAVEGLWLDDDELALTEVRV